MYSQYLELDKDQNGLLSKMELQSYTGTSRQPVRLTPAFIDRIYSEITTYQTAQTGSATPKEGEVRNKITIYIVKYIRPNLCPANSLLRLSPLLLILDGLQDLPGLCAGHGEQEDEGGEVQGRYFRTF